MTNHGGQSDNVINFTARIDAMREQLFAAQRHLILDGATPISASFSSILQTLQNLHETGEINPGLLIAIGDSVLPLLENHVQMITVARQTLVDHRPSRSV